MSWPPSKPATSLPRPNSTRWPGIARPARLTAKPAVNAVNANAPATCSMLRMPSPMSLPPHAAPTPTECASPVLKWPEFARASRHDGEPAATSDAAALQRPDIIRLHPGDGTTTDPCVSRFAAAGSVPPRRRFSVTACRPLMLSAAFQGQVVDFVAVDVVTQAWFLRSRDVAVLVYRWQVSHSDAQQVLRDHDLGEVAVTNGKCHIEIHRQVQWGPVTVDFVVVAKSLASVRRLHHLGDAPGVLGQGADVEAARVAQILVQGREPGEVLLADR